LWENLQGIYFGILMLHTFKLNRIHLRLVVYLVDDQPF
jgi:hypothetical protein